MKSMVHKEICALIEVVYAAGGIWNSVEPTVSDKVGKLPRMVLHVVSE